MIQIPGTVRTWIIPFCLLIFFFFLPLQCFIIGDGLGLGVQGAVYRYQITGSGISLIPVTSEIGYVTSGIYDGKTAVSVILWATGTLIFSCFLMISLIHSSRINHQIIRFIIVGIASSCFLYLTSLVAQYGFFFSGPAGISLPAGIIIMAIFAFFLYSNRNCFIKMDT